MPTPQASIVIPCYNAERYIRATVESALAQTMPDLEVVCVDNNCTDGTRGILEEYARRDARLRIIDEAEPGEGPARDAGLASARGAWLYFLDSDDIMEPTLLDEAISRGEETSADLVVFRTRTLNARTGELMLYDDSFHTDWLPDGAKSVFDPHDHPERILNSFKNWVHNKLFRATFVRERGLRMQHLHNTADLLFTCSALTEAHRIALLDRPLHRYRIMNPQSAMATRDSHPLDFYEAFLALRSRLEEMGTWELYHDSYVNWAIGGVVSCMEGAHSFEGFRTIARTMKDEGLERLGIAGFPRERYEDAWHYQRMQDVANLPLARLVFVHYADLKIRNDGCEEHASCKRLEVAEKDERIRELEQALDSVTGSASYRIGRVATAPLRGIRGVAGGQNRA